MKKTTEQATETTVIPGVKGFDKDFKCKGQGFEKQYAPNTEYTEPKER